MQYINIYILVEFWKTWHSAAFTRGRQAQHSCRTSAPFREAVGSKGSVAYKILSGLPEHQGSQAFLHVCTTQNKSTSCSGEVVKFEGEIFGTMFMKEKKQTK